MPPLLRRRPVLDLALGVVAVVRTIVGSGREIAGPVRRKVAQARYLRRVRSAACRSVADDVAVDRV